MSAWCLCGINILIRGSPWCPQRNTMNNSEVHVAVIAPTNRPAYACPPLPARTDTGICTFINAKSHTFWDVPNTSLRNAHSTQRIRAWTARRNGHPLKSGSCEISQVAPSPWKTLGSYFDRTFLQRHIWWCLSLHLDVWEWKGEGGREQRRRRGKKRLYTVVVKQTFLHAACQNVCELTWISNIKMHATKSYAWCYAVHFHEHLQK